MTKITAINNDDDLNAAIARIDELFREFPNILDNEPGNPQYDELNFISDLVIAYEDIHYPIPDMSPGMAIKGRMENLEMHPQDLIPCIGSRDAVAEVLAGQREVTPEMAQALYERLNIDVRDLLGQPTTPATGD